MNFQKEIKKILKNHMKEVPDLEIPPRQEMGDYAIPCFAPAKEFKKNPKDIAEELAKKIKPNNAIHKAIAVGPYVNFFINKTQLSEDTLKTLLKEKDYYGTKKTNKKKVAIEFSSPNIAKPFGVGHLRSTVIGNAISNLHETQGYKTIRINHLGDWGTQFGKLITAYKKWGDNKKLGKDPIKHLLELYVQFHKNETEDLENEGRRWFSKLEQGDKEALGLWEKFRALSLKEFKRLYARLGVKFDSYAGEAFYNKKLKTVAKEIENKGLLEEDQGAKIIKLEGLVPALIQKSDGSSLYLTRDIAAFEYRAKTYNPEEILYVVGSEQSLHFQQLFKIMELLGHKTKAEHIPFGLFFLPEGKMSTRQGRVVFLEDVLNKVVDLAENTIKEKNPRLKNKKKVAEEVGIGAVIFWDLVHDRIKDIVFDMKRVLDFEGETGPYVQYTCARANSILRKSKPKGKIEYQKLEHPSEHMVIRLLSDYPSTLEDATRQNRPSVLARYLLALSQSFNEFYHTCNCIHEKDQGLRNARLQTVQASAQVLKNGLEVLGIKAPREM